MCWMRSKERSNYWLAWFFLLTLIIIGASSCTCEQRLAHVVKNCPGLVKRDTVMRVDTIVVEARSVDTVFHYLQKDTVIVKENGATIKYYYNTKDSTVYLRGECDTVRIIREVPVQVNSLEVKPKTFWDTLKDIFLYVLAGAFLSLLIFLVIVLKRMKKG